MAFVADNSVVVAWFVLSQANAATDALLGRAAHEDVHVPAILDEIDQLDFIHDSAPPTTRSLVAIARRHALSAYDACYLELALRLRLPLAARDAPLRKAAERAGVLLV